MLCGMQKFVVLVLTSVPGVIHQNIQSRQATSHQFSITSQKDISSENTMAIKERREQWRKLGWCILCSERRRSGHQTSSSSLLPRLQGFLVRAHGEASAQTQDAAGSRHAVRQAHAGVAGAAHKRGRVALEREPGQTEGG